MSPNHQRMGSFRDTQDKRQRWILNNAPQRRCEAWKWNALGVRLRALALSRLVAMEQWDMERAEDTLLMVSLA